MRGRNIFPSIFSLMRNKSTFKQQQQQRRYSCYTGDEMEQFRQELREVMRDKRESDKEEEARKHEEWSRRQQGQQGMPEANDKREMNTTRDECPNSVIGPRDTHFNLGINTSTSTDMLQVIGTLEESLRLQLLAAGELSLPVAKSYEELGILTHKILEIPKALRFYRCALHIYEALAELKIREKGSNKLNVTDEPTIAVPSIQAVEGFQIEKTKRGETATVTSVDERVGSYDVARCLGYIGVCYRDAGKLEKAREFLIASLRMKYATVGQYHNSTAETLNNLGALYHAIGQFQEAADCYEDAIRILLGTLGVESISSPYVAMAYYNLGVTHRATNRLPEAILALSKAHRISTSGHPDGSFLTLRIEDEISITKELSVQSTASDEGLSDQSRDL